ESVNAGIRMLSLTALALQARLQANPAMASAVDTVSGLGASFGLM
ncbi:phage regulatory CII family protein, partial [Enterobacter hormaechei]